MAQRFEFLRPSVGGDIVACRALLQRCGLPIGGLEHAFPAGYVVAIARESIVGCAGVERYADVGLLRSVAVAVEARNTGLGEQLTRSRIAFARALDLESLWLLTTTAPDYFLRLGFTPTDRAEAPASLRGSTEFLQLCPASAICMRMPLALAS